MSDNIRSFRAASVEDALAQIRREMGHEAVVVETKQLTKRSLFSWFATQAEVEVTASVARSSRRTSQTSSSQSSPSQQATASRPLVMQPTTQGTIAAAAAQAKRNAACGATGVNGSTSLAIDETSTMTPVAVATLSPSPQRGGKRTKPAREADGSSQTEIKPTSGQRLTRLPQTASSRANDPLRLPSPARITPSRNAHGLNSHFDNKIAMDRSEDVVHSAVVEASSTDIERRLDSLQQMIAELGRQTRPRGLVEIPPGLFAHYLALIEADVEDEIARELIAKMQQHATPEQLDNTATTTSLLTALIERELRCTEPLLPKRGYRRVAMLVGPTGVGKTTTIAKLAGRFGVAGDLRVGLITVDTYRVAAVDQLRTYAEIIDLPLQVVSSPAELPAALAQFAEFDLVLIDTAGRSPHDERQLEELKQLVAAATPDDICLVLSLTSGARSLRSTAERFAAVRPTSLILTKLDEATGCGGLLSVSRDIAVPISYITLGQEVPRDIEPANACRAARLILGRDRLSPAPT